MVEPDADLPPLDDVNNNVLDDDAVPTKMAQSPLPGLRHRWRKLKMSEKQSFLNNPRWPNQIHSFLDDLNSRPCCGNMFNPQRDSKCSCLFGIFTEELMRSVVDELFKFALLDFEAQNLLVVSWIRYAGILSRAMPRQQGRQLVYVLPGTDHQLVCKNAISILIGYVKRAWYRIKNLVRDGKSISHGLTGKIGNNVDPRVAPLLKAFFEEIGQHALPRATRVVRQLVVAVKDEKKDEGSDQDEDDLVIESLRETDVDVVDLPPSFTKRSMYKRFLMDDLGWEIKLDSTGRILSILPIADKEQVEPIPSWATFLSYWKQNYPKMKIQPPREDICGQCYTFANSFRFKKRRNADIEDDEESSDDDEAGDEDIEVADTAKFTNEQLILEAAKHVRMAKIQRDLCNEKKQEAIDKPNLVRTYTIDYAQNTMMPHFGDEQPGETYYYSPVNVYTLGVVNCGLKPMKLYAHTYFEDEAKKGGNNVASLIYRQLCCDGFLTVPRKHVKEINFVFDNCGGQNKNRMVLRMLVYLVRRKVCDMARAIFLIKGHTKNDCDRMFNLMKKEYRKRNSYTPKDVIDNLSQHPDVKVLRAQVNHFRNWDAFFDKYMHKTEKIKNNHVFTCHVLQPFALQIQEYWGAPVVRQDVVKKHSIETDWGNASNMPEILQQPGMKDIKYKELYDKWRPLIPIEKRNEYKYYKDEPGEEIRGKVKANTKAAKAARTGRTSSSVLEPKIKAKSSSKTGII